MHLRCTGFTDFHGKMRHFLPLIGKSRFGSFLPVIAPCNHAKKAEYRVLCKGVLADEKLSGFISRTTAAKI